VRVLIINLPGFEEGLPDLISRTTLPILQDTSWDGIASCYGASKWYLYLVDPSGVVRTIHYSLDLDAERDRLLMEVSGLVGSKK
jgi:hypothetical protein